MSLVFLGLGSNLGDSPGILSRAVVALAAAGRPVALSSLYLTKARDYEDQPDFCNAVLSLDYAGSPESLLEHIRHVEASAGRVRVIDKGPRTLDVDILLFGIRTMHTPELQVPHPRMKDRLFVLEPLAEICPEARDPESGILFADLRQGLQDQGIYAIHPLLYNGADIWKNPRWNLETDLKTPTTTASGWKTSKDPWTSSSS